jgi:hypothetical protein
MTIKAKENNLSLKEQKADKFYMEHEFFNGNKIQRCFGCGREHFNSCILHI